METRRRRDREFLVDCVFALTAFLAVGGWMAGLGGVGPSPLATVVATLASLAMPVALAWRRRQPTMSAAVIYACALVRFLAAPQVILPADFLVLPALYAVTAYGSRLARAAGLTGAMTGAVLVGVAIAVDGGWPSGAVSTIFVGAVVLTTWALGLLRRARVERIARIEERARRAEVERDQQARLAVAAERARIAREMHDVVAHSLAVVIAQADGGRYAAAADPEAAQRALTTIAETGRSALADVRRILGVLRDGGEAGERAPQPEQTDIGELVENVRASGLSVALVRTGQARPLPTAVGLAAYRIVQEALTNVLKHGGPDVEVTVALHWRPDGLDLRVEDNGRGAAAANDGQGHGLVGMRERALLFGGTVDAGPRPGGGYRVHATIPLAAPPAGAPAAGAPSSLAGTSGAVPPPPMTPAGTMGTGRPPLGPDGRPDPYLPNPGAR